ncbi:Cytochrome C oxidase, cbb3-type, subunit III [Lutimaribacter pacificus]|uniref:Cytochrome C oxidase, cbb3-type, subunit III n=1 Tax=Lutimaribacter pacificus TaxID=391948 RepID=A0A1H0GYK5_9RHOB|nr:cytochrome c [Lutimaribacter pacificus]SDO11953.1 Cytochrome C oxidase, cbb3-type, subunit III [Lutimaribacter pacificus]SHJ93520.1 Cytochrome C oxidase, cbb3-type, subunit III [Lutimaribacter pacificus]
MILVLPGQATASDHGGILPYRDPAALREGARIYADYCASCHGVQLEGQENWRDRDAEGYLPAPPHDASGHTWHHPDDQLVAITKYGIEALVGNGYQSRMIGFGDVLSDQEILATLAYIKSTWPAQIIARHDEVNAMAADD